MTYRSVKNNSILRLRKEADKYKNAVYAVADLHTVYVNDAGDRLTCHYCGDLVSYPCPTMQVIDRELQ